MEDTPKREVAPSRPSLLDLAAALAPWTRIQQIRLIKSTINARPIDLVESSPLQHAFDATTSFSQEEGTLDVRALLTVSAGDILQIDAEFLLNYTFKKEIPVSDEIAAAFGKMNGIFNVWPYWREYVQSTIARAGLPPVALPLMTGASVLKYFTAKEETSATSEPQATAE
jgi:hypothetical protein